MARLQVKICCIASEHEARLALASGADALGLVSEMPSGPGVLPEHEIAAIVAALGPGVDCFLLTARTDPDEIVAEQRRTGVTTLQLCDLLEGDAHAALRAALPGVRLVQVVHVEDERALERALRVAAGCDALLLDSGRPGAASRELGGTGRVHDWALSREIVRRASVPVYLAGGLGPDNVADAIARVRPFGVDLCSGVRRDGRLDPVSLRRFFDAVAGA